MRRCAPVLLVVALAACSSPSAPHQSRFGKVNVQRSEAPSGWAAPQRTSAGEKELLAQRAAYATCLGVPAATTDQTRHEDSPRFAEGAASISSLVFTYGSAATVTDLVAALQGPRAESCYRSVVEQGLTDEVAGTAISSDTVIAVPGSAGSLLTATISTDLTYARPGGAPTALAFDVYDIARGNHLVEVRFSSDHHLDADLRQRIVGAVESRASTTF